MGSNLHEYRLEDCMEAIIDYRGKTPKKTTSGIPLITAKIIKNGRVQEVNEFIAEEDYDSWMRRGIPKAGDVVLTTEAPLGEVAQLDDRKIALAQRVITLRGKKGLLDNDYLKYLLLSKEVQHQLDGRGTGTTVKGIKQSELREIKLRFPEFDVQRGIAHVLKTLDDKIELNRQTNQTLEQMAQALFKCWFVDFDPVIDNALDAGNDIPEALQHKVELRKQAQQLPDFKPLPDDTRALFPSEFEQTDEPNIGVAGWIPKGWSISNIEKCCSHIIDHRGKTPKKLGGDWSDSGFAAISAKNVKGGQIVRPDTIRFVDDDLYKKWMKEPLQLKDIIMTSEAPMGEMYFLAEKADYLLSQRLFAMRADIEVTTGEYLNYWLQTTTARADLEGRATGTTVTGIRQVELKKVIVLLPALSTVNKFSKIVEGFLVRKEHNRNQNSNLEDIRDYLLPKLISGEIKLGKVD